MTDDNSQMCFRTKYVHRIDSSKSTNPKWRVVAISSSDGTSITEPVDIGLNYWTESDARYIAKALNKAIDKFADENELKLAERYVSNEDSDKFPKPRIRRRTRLLDPALIESAREVTAKWLTVSDRLYGETEGSLIEEINRLKCLIVKIIEDNPKLQIHNVSGYWSIKPVQKK